MQTILKRRSFFILTVYWNCLYATPKLIIIFKYQSVETAEV